ncbi:unnamed protein product [Lactuca virosa]|uniref:Uncharacterized protein n=1 Tax=Lactuca virosa TaxID=75947 RepID=A0AAU9NLR6_9ASTR|nr:unnamed protein product [Lactuca virosa]
MDHLLVVLTSTNRLLLLPFVSRFLLSVECYCCIYSKLEEKIPTASLNLFVSRHSCTSLLVWFGLIETSV